MTALELLGRIDERTLMEIDTDHFDYLQAVAEAAERYIVAIDHASPPKDGGYTRLLRELREASYAWKANP